MSKSNEFTSRKYVYKHFNDLKQLKDNRNMDEICTNDKDGFQLQAQQIFLKRYIQENPGWDKLVLYHNIGSGKTCTGITIAEEYIRMNPGHKVTIILPARLRTNFFDELISPCGMEKYIPAIDFATYHSPTTSHALKKNIKSQFMSKINEIYNVISFEKFKSLAHLYGNLKTWCEEMTKDRLIIIDEVHNLLNINYQPKDLAVMFDEHIIPTRAKGLNTLLFRYITKFAHPSCKFIFMTATPIFDNIGQLRELTLGVNPNANIIQRANLKDAIESLRGKVSYFPGTSVNAYPSVSYVVHEVPFSSTQEKETLNVIMNNLENEDDTKEVFLAKQRQITIACLPKMKSLKKSQNLNKIVSDLSAWAPKVNVLLKQLKHPGKHVVFSNFVENGLRVIQAALDDNGWVNFLDCKQNQTKPKPFYTYVVWDGSLSDHDKQIIKSMVNSTLNIDGVQIRAILGSPSIKEGVSFKHIQHLHMIDPVWNQSAKTQVEGRALRFCSHVDVDESKYPELKRHVDIHLYKSIPRNAKIITCDQQIYDVIIPKKYETVKMAEDALKKVAIDYYLFRRLYKDHDDMFSPDFTANNSPVSVNDLSLKRAKRNKGPKNSCPKKRRPDILGQCSLGQEKKLNKKGDECCYKIRNLNLKVK